jgi:hypothetical protein
LYEDFADFRSTDNRNLFDHPVRSKNVKRIGITLCLLIFTAIATVAKGGSPAAQTLVVGTGHPEVDVPAVQAAVDQGGEVI